MYKKDGEYAGAWKLTSSVGTVVNQQFITANKQRYVIDTEDPNQPCHRETVEPLFVELFKKLLHLVESGKFVSPSVFNSFTLKYKKSIIQPSCQLIRSNQYSGTAPAITGSKNDFTLTDTENGHTKMDYFVKKSPKSAVIFNAKTLSIDDSVMKVDLKDIDIDYPPFQCDQEKLNIIFKVRFFRFKF